MFQLFIGLMGGLALFIYGIQCMGDGLQRLTGDKMRHILGVLTSTPVIGVLVGALVTGIVQSSSLTTVMAVGFVQASLLTLKQAISVVMGANIGTTVTAQLVAFDVTKYWALILACGFVVYFFVNRRSVKNAGYIFFSLGMLLLGMVLMTEAMYPLRDSQLMTQGVMFFSNNRLLALLLGLVFTAVVQSSSATIGLLIAMAGSGLITLDVALPILLGSNIGTCITAILASIGTSVGARRVAVAHVLFNVFGAIVFLALIPFFEQLVMLITPGGSITRQIANAHTIFNVISTLIVLPLISPFTKLVVKLVPERHTHDVKEVKYLDWNLTSSPQLAIELAGKEVRRMAELSRDNLRLAIDGMLEKNGDKLDRVRAQEDTVDVLEKEICRYLAQVSQRSMTDKLSVVHTGLLHVTNDIERISDHATNIAELGDGMIHEHLSYGEDATAGIRDLYALADGAIDAAITALGEKDDAAARTVHEMEQKIDEKENELRKAHMRRLIDQECSPETGVLFLDVISNLERVGDHANNIADVAQGDI